MQGYLSTPSSMAEESEPEDCPTAYILSDPPCTLHGFLSSVHAMDVLYGACVIT